MPLSEWIFIIEYSICKEYPALSPFAIEDTAFFKVIDLFSDTRKAQMQAKRESDPDRVIMLPAGDDWF